MLEQNKNSKPSIRVASTASGIAIVAGTAVGAGMFSLPIVSAGMGFPLALACLQISWFCMLNSGLLILEVNLHFPVGSSFNTFVGQTLGPRWNLLNNISLVFVLYILSYAFISGGGSIVSHSLAKASGLEVSTTIAGLLFSLTVATVVWASTELVGRVSAILIGGMLLSFTFSVSQLSLGIKPSLLFDSKAEYFPYTLAALPVYLTAFGFHGNIPSLVKYYGKDPATIVRCIVWGSVVALLVYIVWQATTLGQLSRAEMSVVIGQGGNIGPMVEAISTRSENGSVLFMLELFANFAVITSFVGAGLGLFDYMADRFDFDDTRTGRFKAALVTFLPPTLASLAFPNGFIYAIGYAGLTATIWGTLVPAKAAYVSRIKFNKPPSDGPAFRVWGGNTLLVFMAIYGISIGVFQLLNMAGYLSVFS